MPFPQTPKLLQALQGWGWTLLPLLCCSWHWIGLYQRVSNRIEASRSPSQIVSRIRFHTPHTALQIVSVSNSKSVSKYPVLCCRQPLLPFASFLSPFLTPWPPTGLSNPLDYSGSSNSLHYGFSGLSQRLPNSCTRGDHVMTEHISNAKVPCYME